ncbi:MAG TPA: class I SAM-dependent methyltransferase [Candidatus Absconditabacterales bacterium]|nr:class I SAM-dependent methyltransferase [Candidatus Absconditabacterales bacterium]
MTNVPCISDQTELFLHNIVNLIKPQSILEIGSAYGYSLICFAQWIQPRGGVIQGCERAYPNHVQLSHLLRLSQLYGLTNRSYWYGSFLDAPIHTRKQQPYDLVFVDAQKSDYPVYINHLITYNLIKENAIIVCDDVIKYHEKMNNLPECFQQHGLYYHTYQIDHDDGIIVACKDTTIVEQYIDSIGSQGDSQLIQ